MKSWPNTISWVNGTKKKKKNCTETCINLLIFNFNFSLTDQGKFKVYFLGFKFGTKISSFSCVNFDQIKISKLKKILLFMIMERAIKVETILELLANDFFLFVVFWFFGREERRHLEASIYAPNVQKNPPKLFASSQLSTPPTDSFHSNSLPQSTLLISHGESSHSSRRFPSTFLLNAVVSQLFQESHPNEQPSPTPTLEDCLKLLKGERDEQRLAGLLLVTKFCKGDDLSSLRRVYDAVGVRFLDRLLRTGNVFIIFS